MAQRRGARAPCRAKAQPAGRLGAQQRAAARLQPAQLSGLVGNQRRLALRRVEQSLNEQWWRAAEETTPLRLNAVVKH